MSEGDLVVLAVGAACLFSKDGFLRLVGALIIAWTLKGLGVL